jgi:hypothetical protein
MGACAGSVLGNTVPTCCTPRQVSAEGTATNSINDGSYLLTGSSRGALVSAAPSLQATSNPCDTCTAEAVVAAEACCYSAAAAAAVFQQQCIAPPNMVATVTLARCGSSRTNSYLICSLLPSCRLLAKPPPRAQVGQRAHKQHLWRARAVRGAARLAAGLLRRRRPHPAPRSGRVWPLCTCLHARVSVRQRRAPRVRPPLLPRDRLCRLRGRRARSPVRHARAAVRGGRRGGATREARVLTALNTATSLSWSCIR